MLWLSAPPTSGGVFNATEGEPSAHGNRSRRGGDHALFAAAVAGFLTQVLPLIQSPSLPFLALSSVCPGCPAHHSWRRFVPVDALF